MPFDSDNYELQRSIPPSGVVSDDENEDDSIIVKGGAAAPRRRFMPSLQELKVHVHGGYARVHRYCSNLCWEYLSSLLQITVSLYGGGGDTDEKKVKVSLRRAAAEHPNRPVLVFY